MLHRTDRFERHVAWVVALTEIGCHPEELEDSEFVELQQAFRARYAVDRGFDFFFCPSSSDRIVSCRIRILGLITAAAEPV